MKIKINEKILCIPPYISTSWDQVSMLFSEEEAESQTLSLIVNFQDGKVLKIPRLDKTLIDIAFTAHLRYLETCAQSKSLDAQQKSPTSLLQNLLGLPDQPNAMPFKLAIGSLPAGFENIENVFQHNPNQTNSPKLPPEILDKIVTITQILTNGELKEFPKPEPHCSCFHCQIARSIHKDLQDGSEDEEIVTDEELKFRTWDIQEINDKLYTVTNPLDQREKYTVFIGSPVGCTCGNPNCDHLKAVLSS